MEWIGFGPHGSGFIYHMGVSVGSTLSDLHLLVMEPGLGGGVVGGAGASAISKATMWSPLWTSLVLIAQSMVRMPALLCLYLWSLRLGRETGNPLLASPVSSHPLF